MKSKTEPHEHSFAELTFIQEIGTTSPDTRLADVTFRLIDRIILGHKCACGKFQAFECGPKEAMRALYKELTEGKNNENRSIRRRQGTVATESQGDSQGTIAAP